jgi:hypothetical protein
MADNVLSIKSSQRQLPFTLPAIITIEGSTATKRFLEFFTANIRNKITRLSYARAVGSFLAWCEDRGVTLQSIEPMIVAAYIEEMTKSHAPHCEATSSGDQDAFRLDGSRPSDAI